MELNRGPVSGSCQPARAAHAVPGGSLHRGQAGVDEHSPIDSTMNVSLCRTLTIQSVYRASPDRLNLSNGDFAELTESIDLEAHR
jgi:hypothetical protein